MTTDRLDMKSIDFVSKNIESIAELFPNCVTETSEGKRIDFTLLQQELSGDIVDGAKERYRLEWAGKREAIVNANLRTTNTLRPIREDSVDFDKTENIYIEGDNLEVLKILQESYLNKIKMIYIDPPYNTGNDFIYKDDFKKSKAELDLEEGNIDEQGNRLFANPSSSGRYHSDWLSMMYPRLKLARNLLTEDGVIFISIDDNEVHNLRKICDEVFGEMNFITNIALVNNIAGRSDSSHIAKAHEYLLVYQKTDFFISNGLPLSENQLSEYKYEDNLGKYRLQGLRKRGSNSRRIDRPNMFYSVYYNHETKEISLDSNNNSIEIIPLLSDKSEGCWRWGKQTFIEKKDKIEIKLVSGRNEYDVYEKVYLNREDGLATTKMKSFLLNSDYTTDSATTLYKEVMEAKTFDSPKSKELIIDLIRVSNSKSNSIILDFFSGSSTTAHAVMQLNAEDNLNRKFIMVQYPEKCSEDTKAYEAGYRNICEIGKERIRRAGRKIIEEQRLVLEAKKGELNKKMNGQMSLGNEKELEIEELRQEIESIEKKIRDWIVGLGCLGLIRAI